MHSYCRFFVLIDSSCADFMHTDSVLCKLFADFVHTLSSVNVFHSNAAGRPAAAHHPAEVAVLWPLRQGPTFYWAKWLWRGRARPPWRSGGRCAAAFENEVAAAVTAATFEGEVAASSLGVVPASS
jgi:hypothetical protein